MITSFVLIPLPNLSNENFFLFGEFPSTTITAYQF